MMQYLKIDLQGRAYTYSWSGTPLQPGDPVVVPPNKVSSREQEGRVLRVLDAPDYDGPITEILSSPMDLL